MKRPPKTATLANLQKEQNEIVSKLGDSKAIYTEAELVSFGNYLLSSKRSDKFKYSNPERIKFVYHADLENWKAIKDSKIY